MAIDQFNLFTILEKDDKELIHSSFLKYLLNRHSSYFYESLFNLDGSVFGEPELEVSHVVQIGGKRKRLRLDVQVKSKDNSSLLVVENKFKSFPYKEQLGHYDQILANQSFENKHRYLLCFDPEIISFDLKEWKVISYRDLMVSISTYCENSSVSDDEKIVMKHYIAFLKHYYETYRNHLEDFRNLLTKQQDKRGKFWVRLIYSMLRLELEKRLTANSVSHSFLVNPGSTSSPLIEFYIDSWGKDGVRKMVQFQDGQMKLYVHSNDVEYGEELVDKARIVLAENAVGKFKTFTSRRPQTFYVYKERVDQSLQRAFTIDSVATHLIDFYERMDKIF